MTFFNIHFCLLETRECAFLLESSECVTNKMRFRIACSCLQLSVDKRREFFCNWYRDSGHMLDNSTIP